MRILAEKLRKVRELDRSGDEVELDGIAYYIRPSSITFVVEYETTALTIRFLDGQEIYLEFVDSGALKEVVKELRDNLYERGY